MRAIHSGRNDCILEWKLFEKMNGHKLLITNNKVFEFNEQYIVPASYIGTHSNLRYWLSGLPKITCDSIPVFRLPVSAKKLKKFPTNFNGMILEHLINSMLHVKKIDSRRQLIQNKSRLRYIGELPSTIDVVPMIHNPDGSVTTTRPQDEILGQDINSMIEELKHLLNPMFQFIADEIFDNATIYSQELMIYPEQKILALCDLSSKEAVLEIKANKYSSLQLYAEQLFYEANDRECYILQTDWSQMPEVIVYTISQVKFCIEEHKDPQNARFERAQQKIETNDIALIEYTDSKSQVRLKCKKCGAEWNTSYRLALKQRPCPMCCYYY